MTGAPLPPGADAVVPVEQVLVRSGVVTFTAPPEPRAHVRRPAENFRKGDHLISAGTVVRPQEIGLCITAGVPTLKVARRFRVGVLSTGTELVPPAGRLRRGEVFDSNRPMVLAQVRATGAEAVDLGVISDTKRSLGLKLGEARRKVDLLVTIGGISAGDFDIVKLFLRSYPSISQVRVAMRPAKPQAFGRIGSLFWYALPGNPVSAMVAFDRFVRPLVLRAMGHRFVFRSVRSGVCTTPRSKPLHLREFVRAFARHRAGNWEVKTAGPEGSSNLRSMVNANAFMILPERTAGVEAGQTVHFELFSDPPTRKTPP
jgi:molybdopterin molybdotransferase